MDPRELLLTAARAAVVYIFMLAVIRMLGKRTVGNFSAFDLLVALMLGEVVDELIYGDVMMVQGAVAIVTVALLQYGNSWLSYSSPTMGRILEGQPTPMVKSGQLQRDAMRHERVSEADVLAELRLQGVEDLQEVKLAMIETNGVLSVLREEWAEPAQKADVGAAKEEEETEPAGPQPRRPASKRRRKKTTGS